MMDGTIYIWGMVFANENIFAYSFFVFLYFVSFSNLFPGFQRIKNLV